MIISLNSVSKSIFVVLNGIFLETRTELLNIKRKESRMILTKIWLRYRLENLLLFVDEVIKSAFSKKESRRFRCLSNCV